MGRYVAPLLDARNAGNPQTFPPFKAGKVCCFPLLDGVRLPSRGATRLPKRHSCSRIVLAAHRQGQAGSSTEARGGAAPTHCVKPAGMCSLARCVQAVLVTDTRLIHDEALTLTHLGAYCGRLRIFMGMSSAEVKHSQANATGQPISKQRELTKGGVTLQGPSRFVVVVSSGGSRRNAGAARGRPALACDGAGMDNAYYFDVTLTTRRSRPSADVHTVFYFHCIFLRSTRRPEPSSPLARPGFRLGLRFAPRTGSTATPNAPPLMPCKGDALQHSRVRCGGIPEMTKTRESPPKRVVSAPFLFLFF